jgi:hypothetical protein
MKSTLAIAALVATTFGLVSAVSAAETSTPAAWHPGQGQNHLRVGPNGDMGPGGMRPDRMGMGRGGIIALACAPNGAEALDVSLLRMSYRLDLTDAQKPLFDAFRTKALTTQTSFADQCKTLLPDKSAADKPDMLTGLKARLGVEQARLTAMNTVLPDFEALYNSLTDQQKAALMPHRQRPDGRQPAPGRYGRNDTRPMLAPTADDIQN